MIDYNVPADFPGGSIVVESTTTTRSKPGLPPQTKTRRFSCACLGVFAARRLAPGESYAKSGDEGKSFTVVPFWVTIAGSHAQVQAVAANLRSGRRASLNSGATTDGYVELPNKAGYRTHTVRNANGTTVLTLYLPWAVAREPDERPKDQIAAACLIPRSWLRDQVGILGQSHGLAEDDAQQAAIAAYVIDRLDKRISRPILADLAFRRYLYAELIKCSTGRGGVFHFSGFHANAHVACWPKGCGVLFAHAAGLYGSVAAFNDTIEFATRQWVAMRKGGS